MADVEAVWSAKLQDGISAPAHAAANSVQDLRSQLKGEQTQLAEMARVMRALKGATNPNTEAITALRERMSVLKGSTAATAAKLVDLKDGFKPLTAPIEQASASMGDLVSTAQQFGGPLARVASMGKNVAGVLGRVGVSGALAIGAVAAVLAAVAAAAAAVVYVSYRVAAAVGSATLSLTKYAIAAADARRSESLQLEGLTKTINYWGIAAGKASDVQAAIDRVSDSSALGRADILKYSESLYRMGLRGGKLEKALEATAIVASTQGDSMAQSFMGMAAGAAATGQSVDGLANRIKSRLGGIAQRQALSLNVQMTKLKDNFARLFSGVKIEGLLSGLNKITSLFSQNEATGRALKVVLETLFNPLFDKAEPLADVIRHAFKQITLEALKLAIRFYVLRNSVRDTLKEFGIGPIEAFKIALFGLGGAIMLVANLFAPIGPLLALALYGGIQRLIGFGKAVWFVIKTGLDSNSWSEFGVNIVSGLVAGMLASVGNAVKAAGNLASNVKNAFKTALGIQSPSKVFRAYGVFTAQGAAQGMRQGTPQVEAAAASMVEVPERSFATPRGGAFRAGNTITIENLTVTAPDGADARTFAQSIRLELERVLEGVAVQLGAPA